MQSASRRRTRRSCSSGKREPARSSSPEHPPAQSPGGTEPFVVVDCGAIPADADRERALRPRARRVHRRRPAQAGRFEAANGGTVFLDEIGELPLELQPKLLRVLQERKIAAIGRKPADRASTFASSPRRIGIWRRTCARGRFRRDLYYRLNVFPITMPPLRERRDDLPALVRVLPIVPASNRADR